MFSQNFQLLSQLAQSNPNPRSLGPYSHRHRILTVGDGNLSFSLSLASGLSARNLTATTFDSYPQLLEKYSESDNIVRTLKALGAAVWHSVDATDFEKLPASAAAAALAGPFDRVIFNFPHIGGSTPEDVMTNQELLTGFFKAALPRLAPEAGEIHVALRRTVFYDSWKIVDLAKAAGLVLVKIVPFDAQAFAGYEPRRTSPATREAPSTQSARIYSFKVAPVAREKKGKAEGEEEEEGAGPKVLSKSGKNRKRQQKKQKKLKRLSEKSKGE